MKSFFNVFLCGFAFLLVAGCVSQNRLVQYAPLADPAKPLANPENCRIFVYTQKGFGGRLFLELCDKKRVIGTLSYNNYLCWERAPGEVELSSYSLDEKERLLTFDAKKGEVYYVRVKANILAASPKDCFSFHLVDAQESQEGLSRCKMPRRITP